MSAYAPLITHLRAASIVTDEVSTRIWEQRAGSNPTLPYIVAHNVSSPPHHHLGGAATTAEETYQLDVYAKTPASRDTVKEALRNTLDGYRGTVGAVVVQGISIISVSDDITGQDDGRQSGTYRSTIEARVFYERAEPTL